jgi:hypothetical protein
VVLAECEAGDLQAELLDDCGNLSLEVRTKNPHLNHSLVSFAFSDANAPVLEGFLVLAPDVEGWYTGETGIQRTALLPSFSHLGGTLQVSLVDAALLTGREAQLLSAAATAEQNVAIRKAWRAWGEQAVSDLNAASEVTAILQSLTEQLLIPR